MKNLKLFSLLLIFGFAATSGSLTAQDSTKRFGEYDSTRHITRAYMKIAFQMKRFNEAVNGYVKAIKKSNPSDTTITKDVEMYSDSLNQVLSASNKQDTSSMKTLRSTFDSLVKASVRMVKNVENDSSLRNNKVIKQMNNVMNNLKESIDKYQEDLNQSLHRKEYMEETDEIPEPALEEPVIDVPAPVEKPVEKSKKKK